MRPTVEERFWAKVKKTDGCWEWKAAKNNRGYGVIGMGHRKIVLAHRLSWEISNGPIPPGLFVCHRCDNRECVNPIHMFLGTNAENMLDCRNKGRASNPPRLLGHTYSQGEKHACAKLSDEKVREIRLKVSRGMSRASLAREYSVHWHSINHILLGKTWKHV